MKLSTLPAFILGTVALSASAVTNTATLNITGTVDEIAYLSYVAPPASAVTNNSVTFNNSEIEGGASKSAGTLYEVTNIKKTGAYTVSVKSTNGGKIVSNEGEVINYDIIYDGTTLPTLTTSFVDIAGSTLVDTSAITSMQALAKPVEVDMATTTNALAGVYIDTVTFQIQSF